MQRINIRAPLPHDIKSSKTFKNKTLQVSNIFKKRREHNSEKGSLPHSFTFPIRSIGINIFISQAIFYRQSPHGALTFAFSLRECVSQKRKTIAQKVNDLDILAQGI